MICLLGIVSHAIKKQMPQSVRVGVLQKLSQTMIIHRNRWRRSLKTEMPITSRLKGHELIPFVSLPVRDTPKIPYPVIKQTIHRNYCMNPKVYVGNGEYR